jgi:micrococcal nuclease
MGNRHSSSSTTTPHAAAAPLDKNSPWMTTSLSSSTKHAMEDLRTNTTPLQWTIWGGTAASCLALGFALGRLPPLFRRYATVQDIPAQYFNNGGNRRWWRGRVVSVTDGDTVRFLHVPTIFHSVATTTTNNKLSDCTWSVRICTIDTPETAKFGKPGQPYGEDAKEYLQSLVLNRMVQVRLLERDQYGRVVAEVRRRRFVSYQYVDEAMLSAGLAEVYEGSNAVYGRLGKEKYRQLQTQAQAAKRGIWSASNRESAADYKARTTTTK